MFWGTAKKTAVGRSAKELVLHGNLTSTGVLLGYTSGVQPDDGHGAVSVVSLSASFGFGTALRWQAAYEVMYKGFS